jgi:hypothetical protein
MMGDAWGEPISPDDATVLRRAFHSAGKRAWCYFPPFLCAFSLPPNRIVRLSIREGSVCLMVERPEGVDLFCPPVPFSLEVFKALIREALEFNRDRPTRVLWIDPDDVAHLKLSWVSLCEKGAEYIYDPNLVSGMLGPAYGDLRKRVRRFQREQDANFRHLHPDDIEACHKLLRHWRKRQGRRHPFLLDWGYTKAALDTFSQWSPELLTGWCVEIEGDMKGFALVGAINTQMAQFFVAKTDPEVLGLSEFLRWRVYQTLSNFQLVNDAGDLELDGLRQFKSKFRPVERLRMFSAEICREGF